MKHSSAGFMLNLACECAPYDGVRGGADSPMTRTLLWLFMWRTSSHSSGAFPPVIRHTTQAAAAAVSPVRVWCLSVFGRSLDVIDHQHLGIDRCRLQLQAELFLNGGEHRGRIIR